MSEFHTALARVNAKAIDAMRVALQRKSVGLPDLAPTTTGGSTLSERVETRRSEYRYNQFRDWLYSAVNAIARTAAGQPVKLGRLAGAAPAVDEEKRPRGRKSFLMTPVTRTVPRTLRTRGAGMEWEIIEDHPLVDILEQPNPIQGRWEFVYSFVANLCLTGWSYVMWGRGREGRLEIYALPTTWVTPLHEKGPFSEFLVGNPNEPDREKKLRVGPDQMAVARMPSPSDLVGALAPADTQQQAIRVDQYIQMSQEMFFENGVFPSVIVTVGKEPHPDKAAATRPRLTAPQRRQIELAVRSTMSGVANYGRPAIIDGFIESIEKLSMTQNELGWEKSEQTVRTRILSAFGVHPFILGEPVNVGGHAQAYVILEQFYDVVNCYIDQLSNVASRIVSGIEDTGGRLYVWWEPLSAVDATLRATNLRTARQLGDITPDEFRAELGFGPLPDTGEIKTRPKILDTVGGMQGAVAILQAMSQGALVPETAARLFALFFQITEEEAAAIIGASGTPVPTPVAERPSPAANEQEDEEEEEATEEATDEMEEIRSVLRLLRLDPGEIADRVLATT